MMTEFETRLLELLEAQNASLKNLETAVAEQGKTVGDILRTLHNLGQRPNVVQLTTRVRRAEGELSEMRGKLIRMDAELQRAGRSDAG